MSNIKNKVVVFDKYGATVLINPPNIENLRKQNNVLINPRLDQVSGLPTHKWKKVGNEVIAKLPAEVLTASVLHETGVIGRKKKSRNDKFLQGLALYSLIHTILTVYTILR
ncbi:hypothetical protein M0R04_11505 [Candidatus Dojkabacteria bacterium]|jgi:hypothetical protein|nr:hypothetical protein [Candidatus Dojkabacteria bacterium]